MNPVVKNFFSDYSLLDKDIDVIGGCETQYFCEYLESIGFKVRSSYQDSVATDPYVELLKENSVYKTGVAKSIVVSQIQALAPAYTDIEFRKNNKFKKPGLRAFINELIDRLKFIIEELQKKRNVQIYILTPLQYYTPSLGYFDYRSISYWSKYEMTLYYKLELYKLARKYPDVFILDADIALEQIGKNPINASPNIRLYENKGGHVDRPGAKILAEEFLYQMQINCKKIKRIKLVVFDCDNTLWDGVLREDGIENLRTSRYWLTISRIVSLYERGIVFALCSKNDPADEHLIDEALEKFYSKHYSGNICKMIVAKRINWLPKSENILSIVKELNIGLDSVAFFDDNEFEREEVKRNLPEVCVYSEKDIKAAPDFPNFQPIGKITLESQKRGQMYIEDQKRQQEEKKFGENRFKDFLNSCEMKLSFNKATTFNIDRVVEILQRTNQMNATLKRMSEKEIHSYLKNNVIIVMTMEDKFGEYGIIGTCLFSIDNNKIFIDELALSCRAMGREIENALLTYIINYAKLNNIEAIEILATKTSRNENFYKKFIEFNFVEELVNNETNNVYKLSLDITKVEVLSYPEWFNVSINY